METITDTKSTIILFNRANSQLQNTIFQHSHYHQLCIFASDEQEPVCYNHNNLHQPRQSTVAVTTAEMHHPPTHCAYIHCLVSINVQQLFRNANKCHFFPHGGIQWHTFASCTLPCQMSSCQSAPLLPSVTQQQNVREYWQDGSASTGTSTSDVVGWHNKKGGITFRAA